MSSRFDDATPSCARRRSFRPLVAGLSAALVASCGERSSSPPSPGTAPSTAAASPAPPAASPPASRIERDGLAITFELRAAPGETGAHADATAVITLTDAATGAPARGLRPLAWMWKRGADPAPDDEACRAKVKRFMAGLLSEAPDVDMNGYLVWTLNDDSTISVINPQVAFSKTKLRSLISLSGRPADWALHPDRSRVYVTLPDRGTLAVVDTERSLALANVPVGDGPSRLAVAPDGRTVWVGNDRDGTVSAVDVGSNQVVKTLEVGRGRHALAFSDEGRALWVTSRDADEVALIDTAALEVAAEVEVGAGAVSVAASASANAVYVANETTGQLTVIDPARRAVRSRVALQRGISRVAFEPGGRFAFVLSPRSNEVNILDSATDGAPRTLSGFAEPDALTFTTAFAYVRNLGASHVSLVDLRRLGDAAAPPVIEVQVGQKAPKAAKEVGLAAPFAPTPEDNGALVASPGDKALFYYVEGMMAPIGSLQTYGREPRGVLTLDRTLKEVEPGVYATPVRVKSGGLHDVAVLLDRPRVAACLSHPVERGPETGDAPAAKLSLEAAFDPRAPLATGQAATVRFRLTAPGSPPSEPIDPRSIEVLIARFPGSWRWRGAPTRSDDNTYSVPFTPPSPGTYRMLVGVPSRGAALGSLASIELHAASDPGAPELPAVGETKSKIGGASSAEADRAAARYFTNTEVVDQDGVPHRFYDELIRGRKVLIYFGFTSCKGVCPAMAANLARVQRLLGDRLGKEVVILALSVDPANDTPAALKAFASKFGARPGWYFLTGTPANVTAILKRLGGYVDRPEDHSPTLLVGDARSGYWVKAVATARPEEIVHLVDHVGDER